ncbi:uncharacterized protein [Euphorbia lathyris]|uniref:uncharacterized protein n=1 Tax=Euphorbia lathyris TaxID=212925 RepID=UPI003313E12D
MGKRDLLSAYMHMCAMEADLLQGVADKATIKRLEKELVVVSANVTAAITLNESKDAEIRKLKEKMEEDARDHKAALLNSEIMAGSRAYYYGERIMAYVRLVYPEIRFVDLEYMVPEVEDCIKYDRIPNVKDFLRDQIQKEMTGSGEESKPAIDLESEDLNKVSKEAGDKANDVVIDCTAPSTGIVAMENEAPLEGASLEKATGADASINV